MIAIYVCAGIAVYAALRVVIERNTMRKLPLLNVVSFAVTGIIALLLPHPITIAAAAAYFVGSTLESNAIASTWAGAIFNRDPFDKLISLSVLIAGVFPFIVERGFLDVAIATALIAPLSTIFTLMVCRRVQV